MQLGNMHLNKLRDIKRIKGESFRFSRIGISDEDESSDGDEEKEGSGIDKDCHAFEIDSETKNGRVALLYRGSH